MKRAENYIKTLKSRRTKTLIKRAERELILEGSLETGEDEIIEYFRERGLEISERCNGLTLIEIPGSGGGDVC